MFFLLLSVMAAAQYRVDIWTTDDGLPQNSVTGLTQTADGYLWLTTNDGLVRFDGAKFEIFNKSNTEKLTTNRLVGAFGDKSGRLWFQSEDGAVLFYEKGVFTVAMKPNEIPPVSRSPFFDDQAGSVIFYSGNRNYRFESGKFVPLQIEGLPADAVIILADREGGLWFTGKEGIYRFKDGRVKTYELANLAGGDFYKIAYEDRDGGVWLGYSEELPVSAKVLRIKDERLQTIDFPAASVRHYAEDAGGNLWLTADNRGVYRMERPLPATGGATVGNFQPVAEIGGISANSSGFLCPDREGGMWVGTEKGLVRILPQTIRVFSEKDGLPETNVYPVYEDRSGSIWAGIWPDSLVKYENGVFKAFPKSKNTRFVTSLFEDRGGRFWVGNIGSLSYLENGQLINFTEQAGFHTYTEFSVITEDRDGNRWFGSSKGLSRYSADDRTQVLTQQDGLPDDYIVALLETRNGKIWVGTRGGIASIEKGRITTLTTADGLASNYTRSFYEDADGVLWIGSYDGGLTRLKDGKLTPITAADGLASNGIFCILEDERGWFWINSNQGIFRVSRRELNDFADGRTRSVTSIAYNKQDGLLNVEGNGGRQPAGFKARDGRLWFPTAGGIAVVDPEKVTTNPLPPPVLIEQIGIDRRPVDNEIYQTAVGASQAAVTLSPGQNNLEIDYTGLSFINSKEVRFKYRLDGLEPDWNEVGTRRTAYYSYLPPGDYTFQVIAANRDGVWNTEGATIRIKVFPPFYRTWIFLLLCIFGGLLLILTGYRYRVGQLKRKSLQQENFARQLIDSQETERGRIAAELHDGLSQSLVIIKNRAMMSLAKPEDHDRALEQLREIAEASTCAIDEVKDIIYDLRPIQLDRLGLTGAIEEIAEKIAGAHDLELFKDVDDVDKIFPKEFENSLYRIVQESLNNIIKHAGATRFEVSLKRKENQVELTVKDNGRGFAKGSEMPASKDQKSGFGLVGMTERARLLGGVAAVESSVNMGTTVSVIIPVPLDLNGAV